MKIKLRLSFFFYFNIKIALAQIFESTYALLDSLHASAILLFSIEFLLVYESIFYF